MSPLTPAQQEAIKACITSDQRVEFSDSTPSFWVYATVSDIKPSQFSNLPDAYSVESIRLSYTSAPLFKTEACVYFWPAE